MTNIFTKRKTVIRILSPILIGTMTFVLVRPVLVLAATDDSTPISYSRLRTSYNIDPDGYKQIKYELDGKAKKITNDKTRHADPDSDNALITWSSLVGSRWQIFLYDARTDETTQITSVGNNIHPTISGNILVWEGFVDGVWQIFMFDGIKITQITSGENSSFDADVDGDYIIYSQMTDDSEGTKIYYYQILTGETTLLTPYSFGSNPTVNNGIVSWEFVNGDDFVLLSYSVNEIPTFDQVAGVQTSGSDGQVELAGSDEGVETSEPNDEVGLVIDVEQSVEVEDFVEDVVVVASTDPTIVEVSSTDDTIEEITAVEDQADLDLATEPETVTEQDIEIELGIVVSVDGEPSETVDSIN